MMQMVRLVPFGNSEVNVESKFRLRGGIPVIEAWTVENEKSRFRVKAEDRVERKLGNAM